jgi:hypothetical protein
VNSWWVLGGVYGTGVGSGRRSNAVEGWGECVVEEPGAMTARMV